MARHLSREVIVGLVAMFALLLLTIGCSTTGSVGAVSTVRHEGPPPPGDPMIVGAAVPDWKPAVPEHLRGPSRTPFEWWFIGPRPIQNEGWSSSNDASGRVVSIACHPTESDTVYIAAASGGVWKTTDGGTTWTPIGDELASLNNGVVTLDRQDSNTVYVGTGEYTMWSLGAGLFRSVDAGQTWAHVADQSTLGWTCSGLVADGQTIHWTGSSGYFRSLDGGASWSTRIAARCSSLAVSPTNPQIVWVATHGSDILKSTDGGTTFTSVWTTQIDCNDVHRILLGMAPSNPNRVYAAIIDGNAGLCGMYRTDDGGSNWIKLTSTPNFPSPQGWYDAYVVVDPSSPDTVYCGGVDSRYGGGAGIIRSTDRGANWSEISVDGAGTYVHPDHHALAVASDGMIWIGCDGGVWKKNLTTNRWTDVNGDLAVTQTYAVSLHPTDSEQATGGTQDNGTIQRTQDADPWPQVFGGDGGFNVYDPTDPNRRYLTYVYLDVYRLDSAGFAQITGPWAAAGDPTRFIAPLVMDPNDSNTLLGGTNRVWVTHNATAASPTWQAISTSAVSGTGGVLSRIAVAPSDSQVIYTGASTGKVYGTTNGGGSWTDLTAAAFPSAEVSDIMVDPADAQHVYVSFYAVSGGRIFETTDGGASWNDVTGSLSAGLNVTALAIDWDTGVIVAGTGAGIRWSFDHGGTWQADGPDLPNVNIGDLVIDSASREITAATYGRGQWRASLPPVCATMPGDPTGDGSLRADDVAEEIRAVVEHDASNGCADCDGSGGPPDGADIVCTVRAIFGP